ncbi:MAG: site-specific DNA-methyltransferase [Rhodobacteraceae bacterium]|nr:site-specific DNA-methyltransferase [Paracoccaceae bacterium]
MFNGTGMEQNRKTPRHTMAPPAPQTPAPAAFESARTALIEESDWQDFMRKTKDRGVDLLLTDPPYAISRSTGFAHVKNGVGRFAVSMDFGPWDHAEINLGALCAEAFRLLRPGGTAIIWYDLWKITGLETALRQAGFEMIRLIIWQKTNPVPLNQNSTYLSNSREVAVSAVKGGKPTFNSTYDNGIYTLPIPRHGGRREHPTQKPINLFRHLVEKHSNPGDLVIDPFLGSGTTAVAALEQNRNFKGCDIDPAYVAVARRRVADLNG